MPDPKLIEAIGGLSATSLFILAIIALYTRRVRTQGEVQEDKAEADARLAEMRVDRDEWKNVAKSSLAKLDRLTDVVETLSGRKIPE